MTICPFYRKGNGEGLVTDPFYLKGMATSSSYFKWKENKVATSSLSLQDNADGMTTSAFYM